VMKARLREKRLQPANVFPHPPELH
jgi:hypothetical protein